MTESPTPILYVSHHADVVGSADISLLQLASRVDRRRWTPLMVLPGQGDMAVQCRQSDIPTFFVPMPSHRWITREMRASVRRLREIVRVTDAAVLHANGSRAMMYAGVAGRLEGRRVIWHVRVTEPDRLADRLFARLAHRIVVNSQAVARRFSYVDPARVLCVYNGVDLETCRMPEPAAADAVRRRLGVPLNVPLVMSLGRFMPNNGYRSFVEALLRVAASRPEIHWVLAGDGEERAALESRIRESGFADRVHLSGWPADVPSLLAACDLFVVPLLGEGGGRMLVEAMAMHKPVIATRAGVVPEVVVPGETGLLVPPGDAAALTHAVQSLIANPHLAEYFGRNGRDRVEHRFSLTQHVEAVSDAYRALVA